MPRPWCADAAVNAVRNISGRTETGALQTTFLKCTSTRCLSLFSPRVQAICATRSLFAPLAEGVESTAPDHNNHRESPGSTAHVLVMSAKKASVECCINCNVPELDRMEIDEPLWLERYGEEEDGEVVADTETLQGEAHDSGLCYRDPNPRVWAPTRLLLV